LCRGVALVVVSAAILATCSTFAFSGAASAAHRGSRRAGGVAALAHTASTAAAAHTSPPALRASVPLVLTAATFVGRASADKRPALPLAGKVVGIDPGHNGRNYTDPAFIDHLIWNGREQETCDTTGTETDGGYTEAQFNFNVARFLALDLQAAGAKVILTRTTNDGVGPCVTARAAIIDQAHADVAIDIHADGGPAGGRGFAILEPVPDGPNDHVINASAAFGRVLRNRYRALTGMPVSTYDGVDGIADRDDLAGLNLTTVPKVLIECGNMRNATDAALLISTSFQELAAKAFTQAVIQYLRAAG